MRLTPSCADTVCAHVPFLRSRKLNRWPGSGSWRECDWWHHFPGGGLGSGGFCATDAEILSELKTLPLLHSVLWGSVFQARIRIYQTWKSCLSEFSKQTETKCHGGGSRQAIFWEQEVKTCQRVRPITFMCILCVCTVRNTDEGYPKWKHVSPGVCVRSGVRFHVHWPSFFLFFLTGSFDPAAGAVHIRQASWHFIF